MRFVTPSTEMHNSCRGPAFAARVLRAPAVLATALLLLTACGGGGSDDPAPPPPPPPPPAGVQVSGVVQKGLFTSLDVTATVINEQTGAAGSEHDVSVSDQGFSFTTSANTLVLIEASGEFTHELTGETVVLDEPLVALVKTGTGSKTANVNIASHLSAEMTLSQLQATPQNAAPLILSSDAFVANALGFPVGTNPLELAFGNIDDTSDIDDPNLKLLLYSAAIVDGLVNDQLFDGGFASLADAFASASSAEDVQSALAKYSGFGAGSLYGAIQLAGFSGALPPLSFPTDPILDCNTLGTCSWPPQPASIISVADNRLYEAEGEVRVTARLNKASTSPVNLRLQTRDNSAVAGRDFPRITRELTIPAGSLSVSVDIPVFIDAETESVENFFIDVESLTAEYSVSTYQARVYILDGAPLGLAGQDATELQLLEVCVKAIGDLGGYAVFDCSSAIDSPAAIVPDPGSVAGIQLDLAATCSNCAPQTRDWLVNFFLVAENATGAPVDELFLGPYLYSRRSVQGSGDDADPRNLLLSLRGGELALFIDDAIQSSHSLNIEARLASAPARVASFELPAVQMLPGEILAGDRLVQLGEVDAVTAGDGTNCPLGTLEITAEFVFGPGASTIPGAAGGTVCIETSFASDGSLAGTLVQGSIDLAGTVVPLPPGHSFLFGSENSPVVVPFGIDYLPVPAATDPNGNPITQRSRLFAEGLPFMFMVSGGELGPAGIELQYDDVRYVMDVGYSSQDPRAGGDVISNDILYSGVSGSGGVLLLSPAGGINTTISVSGGTGETAFPKGIVQWQAFSQDITDSEISSGASSNLGFVMRQSTACRSPGCATADELTYVVSADAAQIDGRGFVLGSGHEVPQGPVTPGWGADANGSLAFSRPDDLASVNGELTLALAGYRIPGGGNDRVSDFLLAHVQPGITSGQFALHPLGTTAANDGNYFPTGISVGPETYRNAQGIPQIPGGRSLAGTSLDISDGTTTAGLTSSVASKYVARNAGITGVFNVEPLSLQTPLTFRGYLMDFDRFAIRTVDNTIDDYNWIDGSLVLHGDAGGPDDGFGSGLRIAFSNLEMNCSARFGNANLVYEQCDAQDNNGNGSIDENCNHRLSSWRTDTEIFSMKFNDGQSCAAGNQLLALQQQVFFSALDRPIGMDATWTSDGMLDSHVTQVASAYRLDRLADGSKGFPVRPQAARLEVADVIDEENGRYGWAELPDMTVGVPFWNAIDTDVRVANRINIGQPVAEPTVMVASLAGQDGARNNRSMQQSIIDNDALNLTARYEWGGTGLGFQLPVYYSPQALNGEQPQFLGRRKSADLFVLEAGAGIDFIDPERTKLSFGASADFEKLQKVKFQIDIANPQSLAKVDDLLISLRVINNPVFEPALSGIQDRLSVVNRLADRGLDEAMHKGLEEAIEALGRAAASSMPDGEDPFVTVSRLVAQVRSAPQQLIAILEDDVKGRVDATLQDQRANMAFQLVLLDTRLRQLSQGSPVPAEVIDALDDSIALLDNIVSAAELARDSIDDATDGVAALVLQAQQPVNQVVTALDSIDRVLDDAVSFSQAACSNGTLAPGSSGYLNELVTRVTTIRSLFDILQNSDLIGPLAQFLNTDPELLERMERILRDIRVQTEELATYLESAEDALLTVVCNDRALELLAGAKSLTGRIRSEVQSAGNVINNMANAVQDVDEVGTIIDDLVLPPVLELQTLLTDFRDRLGIVASDSGDALVAALESQMSVLTDGRINKIVADPAVSSERDLLKAMFDPAQRAVNESFEFLADALQENLPVQLPGAYYTPQQLRQMLVATIMESAPVADLRTQMSGYLSEISYRLNNLVLLASDQLNTGIRSALSGLESQVNNALETATAPVRNIPLKSASLDGFAVIAGNELERAHVGAEWTMSPSSDAEPGNTFGAALDAVSWSAGNKTASCSVGADSSRIDVTISAMGLPANFLAADLVIRKLYLGFTLGSAEGRVIPRGVFGGISVDGDIGFSEAIIYDPAFAAGIGDIETYIGASAGALFSDIQAEVAFLVGRTCNAEILKELDPRVGDFITLPDTGFKGVYVRGGASIPLLTFGCPLTVGVGADFGAWVLAGPPATFGGLVGGSAYGKVACIGALRGQILAIGQVNTDGDLFFSGQGFGAAGVGLCEPEKWTTKAKSREDGMCGTGDAEFNATFDNGKWLIPKPKIGAIY